MSHQKTVTATAPAKVILFGEHAVVYGYPAVAIPITELETRVTITARRTNGIGGLLIDAVNLSRCDLLSELPDDDLLGMIVRDSLSHFGLSHPPNVRVRIESSIPIARGLGSSTAVLTAVFRAFADYLGYLVKPEDVIHIVNQVDNTFHGGGSGVDTVVIAYAQSIYFSKRAPPQILPMPRSLQLAIADSGIQSLTHKAVRQVLDSYIMNHSKYTDLFRRIGQIVDAARNAILRGRPAELGPLMDTNNELLQRLGVSNNRLDFLTQAARAAGALGAKLSGAGLGGNAIALVDDTTKDRVRDALLAAGAKRVLLAHVHSTP